VSTSAAAVTREPGFFITTHWRLGPDARAEAAVLWGGETARNCRGVSGHFWWTQRTPPSCWRA